MVIAIIDDGICAEEISIPLELHLVGRYKDYSFRQTKHNSHATVCAKIIEKYSSPDLIIDIPFLDSADSADLSDMCEALEYCSRLNVDIVNLSCGSAFFNRDTADYERLKDVCRKMYYRGVKIFTAQNNKGCITIPAQFPYVTSVEQYNKKRNCIRSFFRRSDIYTQGAHSITLNGVSKTTQACNSYACAYASALAAENNVSCQVDTLISDTINADLSIYHSKRISDDIYELYLDKLPKPVGRLYFHDMPISEYSYIGDNHMRSLTLSDSEQTIKFITESAEALDCEDIPYVFIQKHEKALKIALNLNACFLMNGYKSCVISTDMIHVLSGTVYSPDKCKEKFAKILAHYNRCNILIIVCDITDEKNEDDAYITFEGNGYLLSSVEKNIIVGEDKLYDEIVKLFD